ncbi:MAG: toxin-antitoxin system HicB family antitoxin [Deltaproteobacteria bacterium]|nr:MAG: toxin-antitoxin system HicB family antitoxin [Deltaproteobacteria bacterium]
MSTLSLRLPESIHNKLREISKKESVSINQFISSAISEKLSAFMTEEYISRRAQRGTRDKFLKALEQVPDVKPEVYDKL